MAPVTPGGTQSEMAKIGILVGTWVLVLLREGDLRKFMGQNLGRREESEIEEGRMFRGQIHLSKE